MLVFDDIHILEIRLEKPAFLPKINQNDLNNAYAVYALKNNNRIIKQDGAFLICGLIESDRNQKLNEFRYKENDKDIIFIVSNKNNILRELDLLNINEASMFPEIDTVSKYIKNKW